MKLFWTTLICILGLVIGLNARLDVSGLDTYDEVYRLAQAQGPADLMVWENLFDQRAWVKARLLKSQDCPQVLVLGSSTVGAIRAESLPRQRLLNGWLGGPTVEDFEALTFVLTRSGCVPRHIILGVDHWFLNSRVDDKRWLSLYADYVNYQLQHGQVLLAIKGAVRYWERFKERLNFVTTIESLRYLRRSFRDGWRHSRPRLVQLAPERFCQTISSVYYIRSFDGHYTTCPVFAIDPRKVEALALDYVSGNGHQVREWTQVDPERLSRLERILEIWKSRGSDVLLLAQPFHPITFRLLTADARIGRNLDAMDAQLAAISSRLSGHYVNLRDPSSSGCAADEFEDSHHAKPSCILKLSRVIANILNHQERT